MEPEREREPLELLSGVYDGDVVDDLLERSRVSGLYVFGDVFDRESPLLERSYVVVDGVHNLVLKEEGIVEFAFMTDCTRVRVADVTVLPEVVPVKNPREDRESRMTPDRESE